jgi:hypothetical protein
VGRVPEDAIVAGETAAHTNVYIGQGCVQNGGLIVGVDFSRSERSARALRR